LKGLEDFKIGGNVINTVKYTDNLVILAGEEAVLQGKIDRLMEVGRCYGIEINVEKSKVIRIIRQSSLVNIIIAKK
jgi:hypothetical protein